MLESARNKLIEIVAALQLLVASMEPTPPIDPKSPRLLCWGARVSREFRESVFWIESQLGLKADFLMACMAFETGVTFSPSKKNPQSTATGLIQFMAYTVKWMVEKFPVLAQTATSTEALAQLSAVKQLSWVYYYFKSFKDSGNNLASWDLADTYMAILLPAMIGKPLDTPMAWGEAGYQANVGLDADHNHVITKREAYNRVQQMYDLGNHQENQA